MKNITLKLLAGILSLSISLLGFAAPHGGGNAGGGNRAAAADNTVVKKDKDKAAAKATNKASARAANKTPARAANKATARTANKAPAKETNKAVAKNNRAANKTATKTKASNSANSALSAKAQAIASAKAAATAGATKTASVSIAKTTGAKITNTSTKGVPTSDMVTAVAGNGSVSQVYGLASSGGKNQASMASAVRMAGAANVALANKDADKGTLVPFSTPANAEKVVKPGSTVTVQTNSGTISWTKSKDGTITERLSTNPKTPIVWKKDSSGAMVSNTKVGGTPVHWVVGSLGQMVGSYTSPQGVRTVYVQNQGQIYTETMLTNTNVGAVTATTATISVPSGGTSAAGAVGNGFSMAGSIIGAAPIPGAGVVGAVASGIGSLVGGSSSDTTNMNVVTGITQGNSSVTTTNTISTLKNGDITPTNASKMPMSAYLELHGVLVNGVPGAQ